MNNSFLNQHSLEAPLSGQTLIDRSKMGRRNKNLTATLVLTSLVDAFSILVIYLLINTSSATETLDVSKTLNLPSADKTQALDSSVVVRVEGTQYVINTKTINRDQLIETLSEENKNPMKKGKLIIQADRDVEFDVLNPIFAAGAHAGFENIKFAVWPNEGQSSENEKLAIHSKENP